MSRMRETAQQEAGHQLPAEDIGGGAKAKKSKSKKSSKKMGNPGHK